MTTVSTDQTPSLPMFTDDQIQMVARLVGADPRRPAIIDPDLDVRWKFDGEGWHYTNKTGEHIRHPSAYSKYGWSSMVYHPSDQCVRLSPKYIQECIDNGIVTEKIMDVNTVYLKTPCHTMGKFSVHQAAIRKTGLRHYIVTHPDYPTYHTDRTNAIKPREALSRAIVAWKAQQVSIAANQELRNKYRNRFIGIPHLLAIGACEAGSTAAMAWIKKRLGITEKIGAIRADIVLKETCINGDWRYAWAKKAVAATPVCE